jgi:GntR family transcriptional regulator
MAKQIEYTVNLRNPIAVYAQVENQIQFAVASNRLKPGDTLPSVREMSSILGVNPNTITKAYRDLELLEVVKTRRGVGVTITAEAPAVCKEKTVEMVQRHLEDAVAECVAAGLGTRDIDEIVAKTVTSGVRPYMREPVA